MRKLEPEEEILLETRVHALPMYLSLAVIVGLGALLGYAAARAQGWISPPVGLVAIAVLACGAVVFYRWYRKVYFVTSHRIVWEEGVIGKKLQALGHQKVQDVTAEVSIVGRLLGYGDVVIQSGGTYGALRMSRIPRPLQAADVIQRAAEEFAEGKGEPTLDCPGCGRDTQKEWRLCPNCGASLTARARGEDTVRG